MLILASNSERRIEILTKYNFEFKTITSNFLESSVTDKPKKLPITLAYHKALDVSKRPDINKKSDIIIAADTIVIYKNKIFGKPKNQNNCFSMLKTLNNKTHKVITGVCIIQNEKIKKFKVSSYVKFKNLSDEEITNYINTYKPFDKAGGYGIQDEYSLVKKYYKDYYNIMGLPIKKVIKELKKYGCYPKKD